MKRKSLSRKLLRKLLLPILAAIIAIGGIGYLVARDEIDEVYDSELITAANVLWLVNRNDPADARSKVAMKMHNINLEDIDKEALDEYAQWRAFRLWKNGKVIITSDNARPETQPPSKQGFENFYQDGAHWRSFTLHVPEETTIVEVAEKDAARLELINNIAQSLLWPLLFVLPVIGLLLWRGVNVGLSDLRMFADAIKKRTPDDMTRIDAAGTPTELLPLSLGLNQLLEKLESSLAHERMFMDNAAHELRTPLAALRIQADLALAAKDETQRTQALHELARGVARSAKLVDQMLVLGKIKHQLKSPTTIMFYEIMRQAIKTHVPLAIQKHIEISLTGDETLQGVSQPDLLTTLVNNLLENAIKYTPENGSVVVNAGLLHKQPVITITDTGPGIPEAERQKVFDRFYRISDHAQTGSGLGLAIVKHIADILQIHISLDTPDNHQGLQVSLHFPG